MSLEVLAGVVLCAIIIIISIAIANSLAGLRPKETYTRVRIKLEKERLYLKELEQLGDMLARGEIDKDTYEQEKKRLREEYPEALFCNG